MTATLNRATASAEPSSPIVHDDVRTRAARGKAARKDRPRAELARWEAAATRPDPVGLLSAQEATRVPELVAIRHERMLESPFAFYRGAAVIMAADLGSTPHTGLWVQCCGDAHLANIGGFASPERDLVFDINDFDETSRGPFEWDIKRLATSFEIAGRSLELAAKDIRTVVLSTARAYREAIAEFAAMGNLAVRYARFDAARAAAEVRDRAPRQRARLERAVAKAHGRDNLRALGKLTRRVNGELRFASDPPLLVPIAELFGDVEADVLHEWLRERLRVYRESLPEDRRHLVERYRLVDVARKVVGVGSVGTRCWVALLLGRDENDALFLQVKEAESSVLEPYAGQSPYPNHGQRVVEGQRLMQASSDILLGWTTAESPDGASRDFYLRQLWDWKVSAEIDQMNAATLRVYAWACAWLLARGHAVSGDSVAIASYLGTSTRFDEAVAAFASAYADQNQADYDTVTAEVAAKRY
jgi:uncharacterized protein (DUF2252 family)